MNTLEIFNIHLIETYDYLKKVLRLLNKKDITEQKLFDIYDDLKDKVEFNFCGRAPSIYSHDHELYVPSIYKKYEELVFPYHNKRGKSDLIKNIDKIFRLIDTELFNIRFKIENLIIKYNKTIRPEKHLIIKKTIYRNSDTNQLHEGHGRGLIAYNTDPLDKYELELLGLYETN
jgi:hypothetical protein